MGERAPARVGGKVLPGGALWRRGLQHALEVGVRRTALSLESAGDGGGRASALLHTPEQTPTPWPPPLCHEVSGRRGGARRRGGGAREVRRSTN
jgi:hypothetical protein